MVNTAIILAAGEGTKIWPYGVVRPKSLIPIAGQSILEHQIRALKKAGIQNIKVAIHYQDQCFNSFSEKFQDIEFLKVGHTKGTADTLQIALSNSTNDNVLVLYGDALISEVDLNAFIEAHNRNISANSTKNQKTITALLNPHNESSRNYIGCIIAEDRITEIIGHSRSSTTHHFLGFIIPISFKKYLKNVPPLFPNIEVGMMPPDELFLESAMIEWMNDDCLISSYVCRERSFDIDKPWHIVEANQWMNSKICESIKENVTLEGSTIDSSATINGFVRLGRNSHIGKNVIIEGNVWIGNETNIKHGAILKGSNVIGNHCEIGYFCYIETGSTIGDHCKVLHAAELDGILFPGVYLYHYMEIAGIVGQNSDIGAGTVCGSLRFDDGLTKQKVKGRVEQIHEQKLSNACYIGDYSRTGINAILLPGVKTGARSIVGPGVILDSDLEDETIIMVDQKTVRKKWSTDRYGW